LSAPADAERPRAVFLDRDGVINELVLDPRSGTAESPYDPADVRLMEGVPAALRRLREAGYALVSVSNQPAAAKEITSLESLEAVHRRVVEALAADGVSLDSWRYCHHHPDATEPSLRALCACRKPEPGMIIEAAEQLGLDLARSWVVGDADRDIEAGRAAGCRTVLVENPRSAHRRSGVAADRTASGLGEAVGLIIAAE
jgi:D-glycero-D-manno-heptose 1,7-bisphosphate phosphatase